MGGTGQEPVKYPREIEAPEGLPPGWKCFEHIYLSGKCEGQNYVRFTAPWGKAGFLSVKAAIKAHAEHHGQDGNAALAEYERLKKDKADQLAKERQEAGILKGEAREAAVEAFRKKYGPLDGATAAALPGWRAETRYLENCGQTHVTYYDPQNRAFTTVKSIEACFGARVLNGEDVREVEEARSQKVDGASRNYNPIRRAFSSSLEAPSKGSSPSRLQRPEDYQARPSLAVLKVGKGGLAEQLQAAEAPDPEELQRHVSKAQALLATRGFSEDTALLAVFDRQLGHRLADAVGGVYYQLEAAFNGRPCYQQLAQSSGGSGLACRGVYMFWSRGRWKLGKLDDAKVGLAYCSEDRPSPVDVSQPWMLLQESTVTAGAGGTREAEGRERSRSRSRSP